jgi:tetratricopeptide (TPR) repeat protein
MEWDWAGAEPEWRRTLELDPRSADAHASFAHFLAVTGRIDEALPHSEQAIELDPFNARHHAFYSVVLHYDRRYDDAMAAARTALAMQPSMGVARLTLQYVLFSKGMRDEWLANQREQIARDPELVAAFDQGLAEAGYEGAHRAVGDLLAARWDQSGGVRGPGVRPPKYVAGWYLFAGDYHRTIDWLEKSYEARTPTMPYLGRPVWDPLRSDPRFQDLLRRMNLPQAEVGS